MSDYIVIAEGSMGVQGIQGIQGVMGTVTPEVQRLHDETLVARDGAMSAKDVVVSIGNNAKTSEVNASVSAVSAASSANAVNLAMQNIGTLAFATVAMMNADLAHAANVIALVTNDPINENNGQWIKLGISGAGSWQKSAYVPPVVDNSIITSKIANLAVTNPKIAKNAVSYDKTNFMKTGKNLFNKSTISQIGNWYNYVAGAYESYPTNQYIANYHYSDLILVKSGTAYTRKYGQDGTSFLDANMTFISGSMNTNFTTPANAVYVILSVQDSHLDEQLELGSVSTTYEPYGLAFYSYAYQSIPKNAIADDTGRYQLNLPAINYGVVGKELNIYFDNLMIDDASRYNFNAECAIGGQENDRWTVVPAAPIVTNLSIDVFKDCGDIPDLLTRAVSTLRIVPVSAGTGLNKTYLQIGDSTTWNMMNYGYVTINFTGDPMAITQIGTQGTAPNKHEGYPGKDTNFIFSDPASPFVHNGVFDYMNYINTNGLATPDFVTLAMGINDMYGMQSDAQANAQIAICMAQYEAMITNIHAQNPLAKVGILLTIPPARSQDAFFGDGANAQTQFRHKRNITLWVRQCIKQFSNRESSNIYVVPYSSNLDTVHNFSYQESPTNARNPVIIKRQANALHPDFSGCWQMADAVYFWIKNMV